MNMYQYTAMKPTKDYETSGIDLARHNFKNTFRNEGNNMKEYGGYGNYDSYGQKKYENPRYLDYEKS